MSTIKAGEVRPGKCFTSKADGRVRRVLQVRDGSVQFELRKGPRGRQTWEARSEAPLDAFIEDLAKEVGCDHVP